MERPAAGPPRRRAGGRRDRLPGDRPAGAQKNALKPRQKRSWCLPEVSGEFVWRMEDVLELYAEPYDPARPVVGFDEASKELHGEVNPPLPARPGDVAREDYEYTRRGAANIFLSVEPLTGRRHLSVTERHTRVDFAHQM